MLIFFEMCKYISDTEIYFTSKNTVEHWELHFGDDSKHFIISFVMYVTPISGAEEI